MDEIEEMAMMSDEELLRAGNDETVEDLAMMSDEELLRQGGIDPSQLPAPQTGQMRDMGGVDRTSKIAAHNLTGGMFQHPVGALQGLFTGAEQFSASEGQPFLDRLGAASEGFSEGYGVGRDVYNKAYNEAYDEASTEEAVAGTATGLVAGGALLKILGLGGKVVQGGEKLSKAKKAAEFGKETAKVGGIQGTLGFLGSQGETVDEMALEGLAATVIGTGLPVGLKGADYAGQKINDAANLMWEASKKGATHLASFLQDVPVETLRRYASFSDDKIMNFYAKTGAAKKGRDEIVAKNFTDGVRKSVENKRVNLSKQMTEEVDRAFGDKPLSDKHMKFLKNQFDDAKKGLDPTIESHKEVLDKITKYESMLAPHSAVIPAKKVSMYDMLAGRREQTPTVITQAPSYRKVKEIYDDMRDLTNPSYIRDKSGNVAGANQSTKTSRVFKKLLGGVKDDKGNIIKPGIQDGFIRKLSPKLKELDKQYVEIHNIKKEATQSLIKSKGSTKSAWTKAGSAEGTPFMDAQVIQKNVPETDVMNKAQDFAAMTQVGDAPAFPRNFSARAIAGAAATASVGAAGLAGFEEVEGWVPMTLGLLTLGMSPLSSKIAIDAARKMGRMGNNFAASKVGRGSKGLGEFLKDTADSQNALRVYNEEIRKRLGMNEEPQSPLQ